MNVLEAIGRIHAGRRDLTIEPRVRLARPAVVFCHGYTGDATQAGGYSFPGAHTVLQELAARLLLPVVATSHVDGFGNAVSKTEAVDNALTFARTAAVGAGQQPCVLVGLSAGAAVALDYAADHPALVACVVGIIPLIDVQAARVSNVQALRAPIDAAHGVVYPAALPAGVDPATRTTALAAVPQQLWTASDDTVSANAAAYAAAVGAELRNVGATGHTPASAAAVLEDQVVAFVRSHL